jgi:hypothetical protein
MMLIDVRSIHGATKCESARLLEESPRASAQTELAPRPGDVLEIAHAWTLNRVSGARAGSGSPAANTIRRASALSPGTPSTLAFERRAQMIVPVSSNSSTENR